MDELIFQFLLQAGYPRASIVAETTLSTPGGVGAAPEDATTYAIVDPDTAEPLAAIEVVEAIDEDGLRRVAAEVGRYASRVGGGEMQGFVIRVDPHGHEDAEQVQFFRVWPDTGIRQLSAKTFPDLDTLRVARRLSLSGTFAEPEPLGRAGSRGAGSATIDATREPSVNPARRYVPAALLLSLAIVDGYLVQVHGEGFLTPTQALLAVGAAVVVVR